MIEIQGRLTRLEEAIGGLLHADGMSVTQRLDELERRIATMNRLVQDTSADADLRILQHHIRLAVPALSPQASVILCDLMMQPNRPCRSTLDSATVVALLNELDRTISRKLDKRGAHHKFFTETGAIRLEAAIELLDDIGLHGTYTMSERKAGYWQLAWTNRADTDVVSVKARGKAEGIQPLHLKRMSGAQGEHFYKLRFMVWTMPAIEQVDIPDLDDVVKTLDVFDIQVRTTQKQSSN